MGVNFKTSDGVVHRQAARLATTRIIDETWCGLFLSTNHDGRVDVHAKRFAAQMDEWAECTTEKVSCVLCLGR